MSSADRIVSGLVADRYAITGLIATGGMGSVYRARDTVLERTVALKVLKDGSGDPSFVARFRAEATNAARLSHPNIVQIYDFGYADEMPYISMEYVDGQNLREVLTSKGVLRPEHAAQIGAQVAAALEHARRAGIVHRDVKPENIIVTTDGQVKVADFGLSLARAESRATQAGTLFGTAHYLAPEQVQGRLSDHRTDIYALGIVMYEMLTGHPPFSGDSPVAIAYKRVNEDVPSVMATNPSVPRALDAIVIHATAREPEDRYPSPGAMAEALRSALPRTDTGEVGLLVHHTTAVPLDGAPTVAMKRSTRSAAAQKKRRVIVAAITAFALIAGSYIIATQFTKVAVPSVMGATQEEARSQLRAKGFVVDTELKNDGTVPSGHVIAQRPAAGASLRSGGTVHLIISIGPEALTLPNVIGQSFANAQAILSSKGFDVTRVDRFDDSVPALQVIDESPQHDLLIEKGTTVTLTVSKGIEPVRVPDLVGDPETSARAQLRSLGLLASITREQNGSVPAGMVISQSPDARTTAKKGSVVRLVISAGPPLVKVPSLRCKTRAQAADSLAHSGFKATYKDSGNRVVDQFPAPGDSAPKGSTVTVYLGYGSFC